MRESSADPVHKNDHLRFDRWRLIISNGTGCWRASRSPLRMGAHSEEGSSRATRPVQEPSKLRNPKRGEDLSLPVLASPVRRE
jgi:hypothetical protein